jgi:small subunit ribosomal protein S18
MAFREKKTIAKKDNKYKSRRPKECYFKSNGYGKTKHIDWTDVDLLRKFISDNGKILPRSLTGVCAKWQRPLAIAIKRARHMALLPFVKN